MGNIYYLSSAEIIIFLTNMDFHQQDIRQFLKESIPFRFKALSPPEFGDFIRYLFEVDGYDLLPVEQTGEFDGLLQAQKEDTTLVIMPLRMSPDAVLGEDVISKAIRAREFYDADQSWVITTATFSPESRQLAEEAEIELWDWDALYAALCQLFFEGKNHMEFFDIHPPTMRSEEAEAELKLKARWQAAEGTSSDFFNLSLSITNPTDRNIYLHLELPALIDHQRNQVMADQWVDGEFVAGLIYAGAAVKTNALFSVSRLGDRPPGGRIVLTCHERVEVPRTYHLQARLKGQACFVVTYCYTTSSAEYRMMTAYRDQVLDKSPGGRLLIRLYYFVSPMLVSWAGRSPVVDTCLRKVAGWSIPRIIARFKTHTL
jgi:hypothetical protein